MRLESAPEKFGPDTEDFDEGLIEAENFLIDLGLSQFIEVDGGPRVACVRNVSFIRQTLIRPTKYPLAY